MLFRADKLRAVKGFDPGYFLYYEDSDIGRKLQGMTHLRYLPSFKVTHLWARESHKSLRMKYQMLKSGLRYLRKWGGMF